MSNGGQKTAKLLIFSREKGRILEPIKRDSFLQNSIVPAIRYKIIIDFYILFMVVQEGAHLECNNDCCILNSIQPTLGREERVSQRAFENLSSGKHVYSEIMGLEKY